jgi:hypothetical protein
MTKLEKWGEKVLIKHFARQGITACRAKIGAFPIVTATNGKNYFVKVLPPADGASAVFAGPPAGTVDEIALVVANGMGDPEAAMQFLKYGRVVRISGTDAPDSTMTSHEVRQTNTLGEMRSLASLERDRACGRPLARSLSTPGVRDPAARGARLRHRYDIGRGHFSISRVRTGLVPSGARARS